MKKKAKLFTTIASLCLAVALMAFGVYAAKTAELSVSSTITYEASNIKATFKYAAETAGADAATGITGLSATEVTSNQTFTVALTEGVSGKYFGYIVTVTNNYTANQSIDVTLTDTSVSTGKTLATDGFEVTVVPPTDVAGEVSTTGKVTTIAPTKSATWAVYFTWNCAAITEAQATEINLGTSYLAELHVDSSQAD